MLQKPVKAFPACPVKVDAGKILDSVDLTEVVRKELERLDKNKAAGPDGIPSIVLKHCADELALPLSRLFNKTLIEEGGLPQD